MHNIHLYKPNSLRVLNINLMFGMLKKINSQWHNRILSDLKFDHKLMQEFYTLSIDNNEFMELIEHW